MKVLIVLLLSALMAELSYSSDKISRGFIYKKRMLGDKVLQEQTVFVRANPQSSIPPKAFMEFWDATNGEIITAVEVLESTDPDYAGATYLALPGHPIAGFNVKNVARKGIDAKFLIYGNKFRAGG